MAIASADYGRGSYQPVTLTSPKLRLSPILAPYKPSNAGPRDLGSMDIASARASLLVYSGVGLTSEDELE